jgi:2-C-methyl-D-erythritol 4-phosphate cytidylyltransferase
MNTHQSCWAIIPAAGVGKRMGQDLPKQYLKLHDKYVLEYSIRLFSNNPLINGVVVVISDGDPYWGETGLDKIPKVMVTQGGVERCHSVQNGLKALKAHAGPEDWILVHDAARPCLDRADLDKMILALEEHPVGGILAIPTKDTMKRANDDGKVVETVNRENLWHALTPQMFRYSLLESAIDNAISNNILVTDEAQAVELYGKHPQLVEGKSSNIKITNSSDLVLAEYYLSQQGDEI